MSSADFKKNFSPASEIRRSVEDYSLEELKVLLAWLKSVIKERKQSDATPIPLKKGRELVESLSVGSTVYRLEKVKCGKKKCKCTQGKLHGPYWYSYHWNGKKLSSTYIGKTLKEPLDDASSGLIQEAG